MTRTKFIPVVVLILALLGGGGVLWHFVKPTESDTQTEQAQTLLQDLGTAPTVPTHVATPKAKPTKEPTPSNHAGKWAAVTIPAINVTRPLIEGTTEADLARGISHYIGTALPGQVGNFSLAGHVCCASNGQPFRDLYKLRVGDEVYVDTKMARYTYAVIKSTACGPSQQIVSMYRTEVIKAVPCSDAKPTQPLMTLTTCYETTPHKHAVMRQIVYAELIQTEYKS